MYPNEGDNSQLNEVKVTQYNYTSVDGEGFEGEPIQVPLEFFNGMVMS